MSILIDADYLSKVHLNLPVEIKQKFQKEIKSILNTLWKESGDWENILRPFFLTYLEKSVLAPLYIYHEDLKSLTKASTDVMESTTIADIILTYYGIELSHNRINLDFQYLLGREYHFNKRCFDIKKHCNFLFFLYKRITGNTRIIYANAGKLDKDFKKIKGVSLYDIPFSFHRPKYDSEKLIHRVISRINSLHLSIPNKLVIKVLEHYVFQNLGNCIERIIDCCEFIKKNSVKLVIVSAAQHEDHLVLLAAAKIENIKSLLVGHGYEGGVKNPYLDGFVSYQATINQYEWKYFGAKHFEFNMNWFSRENF